MRHPPLHKGGIASTDKLFTLKFNFFRLKNPLKKGTYRGFILSFFIFLLFFFFSLSFLSFCFLFAPFSFGFLSFRFLFVFFFLDFVPLLYQTVFTKSREALWYKALSRSKSRSESVPNRPQGTKKGTDFCPFPISYLETWLYERPTTVFEVFPSFK